MMTMSLRRLASGLRGVRRLLGGVLFEISLITCYKPSCKVSEGDRDVGSIGGGFIRCFDVREGTLVLFYVFLFGENLGILF